MAKNPKKSISETGAYKRKNRKAARDAAKVRRRTASKVEKTAPYHYRPQSIKNKEGEVVGRSTVSTGYTQKQKPVANIDRKTTRATAARRKGKAVKMTGGVFGKGPHGPKRPKGGLLRP